MINIPQSTIVNRFIPKEKFYNKTIVNNKLRQLFTDEVEKIVWTNKISPQTINISAGEYLEMQIFEISLKADEISPLILKHIDANIPYPILFILKKNNINKVYISFKESSSSKNILMKIDAYFNTEWEKDINLELKGRSVDEIYKNFLSQIAPNLKIEAKTDVKLAIENNQFREKILKQIDILNRMILNEPSISRQQEMARERYLLEKEL